MDLRVVTEDNCLTGIHGRSWYERGRYKDISPLFWGIDWNGIAEREKTDNSLGNELRSHDEIISISLMLKEALILACDAESRVDEYRWQVEV